MAKILIRLDAELVTQCRDDDRICCTCVEVGTVGTVVQQRCHRTVCVYIYSLRRLNSTAKNSIARQRVATKRRGRRTLRAVCLSVCLSLPLKSLSSAGAPRVTKSTKQIRRLPSNFASGIEIRANLQRVTTSRGESPGTTDRFHLGAGQTVSVRPPCAARVSELSHYGRRQNSRRDGQRCGRVARGDKTGHNQFRTNELNCVCGASKAAAAAAPEASRCRPRSLSIIAEVALISPTEDRPTIKYYRPTSAPLFNPRHSCSAAATVKAQSHSIFAGGCWRMRTSQKV